MWIEAKLMFNLLLKTLKSKFLFFRRLFLPASMELTEVMSELPRVKSCVC